MYVFVCEILIFSYVTFKNRHKDTNKNPNLQEKLTLLSHFLSKILNLRRNLTFLPTFLRIIRYFYLAVTENLLVIGGFLCIAAEIISRFLFHAYGVWILSPFCQCVPAYSARVADTGLRILLRSYNYLLHLLSSDVSNLSISI